MKNRIETNVRKGGTHKADPVDAKAYHAKVKKDREDKKRREEEEEKKKNNPKTAGTGENQGESSAAGKGGGK